MNGKSNERDRPVLLKGSVHKELKMLSVTSNVKVQRLVNLLLEAILKDKEKVRELLLEHQVDAE